MRWRKMENRQALRDPDYSLADRRREEEALRTAVDMLAPEHRPLCAFPLGDAPEVRLEYPHHHWLYTDDRPEPQMLDALGRLCDLLGYHFHVVLADTLGARGAECLRNSTGVEAREGGVLLTVICVKFREQIWRIEEEK